MVIAIDGPAASGKGTLAKRLALHYGLPHLDTGLLYRAVALALLDAARDLADPAAAAAAARGLRAEVLDDPRLRGSAMGEAASIVSAQPAVRAALLDWQRRFAGAPEGAVLDGRDIGTVVCPDAAVKLFVTASAEERARRRHRELDGRGEPIAYEAVLADILRRDARDADRDAAPLRVAEDAVVIDTTALDADAAFRAATDVVDGRGGPKG
ncbi:cytidylate kinase [Methylobacterium variabile]|jgi:cytidylate kinase|uniref:Cytidylate kinase n=1 Tax=Methylobacterium variabile TaxID=298794 RepID=A0A0J6SL87_9HYPH|nr:(d)CMP kinase [Methylobacterium variabile]KMO35985.1 cytidylate kinase [Methylobacterium variabile]